MRNILSILPILALACTNAPATRTDAMATAPPDSSAAKEQAVVLHPIHHATLEMEWNKMIIYVDPADGSGRFKGYAAPDLILITDIHPDHLDTATLRGFDLGKARIIAPQAVVDMLPADLKKLATVMANGTHNEVAGIAIDAIPMYNMPDPNDPRHPKGRGNGYVLTMGGERIYISGDTEDIPEMRALKNIDVAFVCMNLPYTMSVEKAASGVLAFKPRAVYPYHYHNQDGTLSDVAHFKQLVNAGDATIDVRLVDWYK